MPIGSILRFTGVVCYADTKKGLLRVLVQAHTVTNTDGDHFNLEEEQTNEFHMTMRVDPKSAIAVKEIVPHTYRGDFLYL